MRIPLDRSGGEPLVRQIERWLRAGIESGALPAGARLPASRALAEHLGVGRITVVNAYAALETDGLIVTRGGSGTFVAERSPRSSRARPADAAVPWPRWQQALERPAEDYAAESSDDRDAPDDAGVIAFTGVGDPRLFAVDALARSVREVLRRDGSEALRYGALDRGHAPLRATVAGMLTSQGIRSSADQVMITTGSQQALALICHLLLRPGDAVLIEQPTYDHALDLFRTLGARLIGVPIDGSGLRTDRVDDLLRRHRPRLIYTIPTFQNPTGVSLAGGRRRQLIELAAHHDVPVVEDDFVGDLRYEGRALPALKALDPNGRVVYLGSFAKLLAPALRVGYVVADGPVLARLAELKRVHDLTTSPLLQRVVDHHVSVGRYQSHLRRTVRLCRIRRDALVTALAVHLPQAACTPPRGGLFAWLTLPAGVTAHDVVRAGRRAGVEVAPGNRFFVRPQDGDRQLRLNFAALTPAEIMEGIARLGTAIHRLQRGG